MPKIILPGKVKCWRCEGRSTLPESIMIKGEWKGEWVDKPCPDCEDGYRWNLGDLYRAVEDAGAIPDSKLKPKEGAPDYIAVILTCGSEHEDRGATHEEAMVNVINKVNEEAE